MEARQQVTRCQLAEHQLSAVVDCHQLLVLLLLCKSGNPHQFLIFYICVEDPSAAALLAIPTQKAAEQHGLVPNPLVKLIDRVKTKQDHFVDTYLNISSSWGDKDQQDWPTGLAEVLELKCYTVCMVEHFIPNNFSPTALFTDVNVSNQTTNCLCSDCGERGRDIFGSKMLRLSLLH